ncbi:MAG TPA: glycosyl hydrolase [Polyangiaceae bacterium]
MMKQLVLVATCVSVVLTALGCSSEARIGTKPDALFGAAAGDGLDDLASLEALEERAGRRMAIDRVYRGWDNAAPGAREQRTIAAGRIPLVSFNGGRASESPVRWANVASGTEDAHLREVARAFRALGENVFVVYHQNPDKDETAFGRAEEYRAAYRQVVAMFRAEGASNVRFVWSMRSPSFPSRADDFYPGDDVVEWIGANAYNYGSTAEGTRWLSLRALVADFLSWAAPHRKLLMLAEFGCSEEPGQPARKADWLSEASSTLRDLPEIRAAVYFTVPGSESAVDTSPQTLAAFRALVHEPHFALLPSRRE